VSPPRSVIFDAELCEHAGRQPAGVPFASHGKLNDLLPDQLCHAISQADGERKFGAHGFKRPLHDAICSTSNAKSQDVALGMAELPTCEWGRPRPFITLLLGACKRVTDTKN
jgi:hypothetical protein